MCTEQDKEFFNKCNNAPNIDQMMRLICVCLALDFKAAIFSLFAFAETLKKEKILFEYIRSLEHDYKTVTGWVDGFIETIPVPYLIDHALNVWTQKKAKFNENNFDIKKITTKRRLN